jgi:hypothetical protein
MLPNAWGTSGLGVRRPGPPSAVSDLLLRSPSVDSMPLLSPRPMNSHSMAMGATAAGQLPPRPPPRSIATNVVRGDPITSTNPFDSGAGVEHVWSQADSIMRNSRNALAAGVTPRSQCPLTPDRANLRPFQHGTMAIQLVRRLSFVQERSMRFPGQTQYQQMKQDS